MYANRPRRLIGVLGTHTEVGKTYVAMQWLAALKREGLCVAARKPVQSFNAVDSTTDAKQLGSATGEDSMAVCPSNRWYPRAYAPPMAADVLCRPRFKVSDLLAETRWHGDIDVGIVETVGGPRSPIAHDGDSIDLLRQLQPDGILLVADAGLGTLNAVRMSLDATAPLRCVVYLNRYRESDELHRMNRRWLIDGGVEVVTDMPALSASFLLPSLSLTRRESEV